MRRAAWLIALVLAGCARKEPATGIQIDPALETLVPADTVLMVDTRLANLLKTPVYQKYFAGREIPQIEQFASMTGLDPRKDLSELLFVSNGKQGVLLGRGKFDHGMEAKLDKEGAERSTYKGHTLIGNGSATLVLMSPGTAAVGEPAAVRSLIDRGGPSSGPPAALAALLKGLPQDAQFWAAYTGGNILGGRIQLPFDPNSNLANVNKLVGSVESGSVYFDLRNGLEGRAEGNCSSEESAQQVHDALKALVGLGRLSVRPDQEDLLPVYDSIQVMREARRVSVRIGVAQELVDKFLGVWMGGPGSGARPKGGH